MSCSRGMLRPLPSPALLEHRGFPRRATFSLVILFVLLIASAAHGAKHGNSLSRQINAILRVSHAEYGFWGIEVVRLSDGEILYARNSRRLFLPASNMKLFTTAAALSTLGPNFVFKTTVESSAPPDSEGRVPDLAIVGRGDPNLGSRALPYQFNSAPRITSDQDFANLADQIASKGIREVTGNLYADDTYYVYEPYGTGWTADDLEWDYGAPVTALAFNDNSLQLEIQPATTPGAKARILLDPPDAHYKIVDNVQTTTSDNPAKVEINRFPGSMELEVWGHVQAGSDNVDEGISLQNPPQYIGEMFRRLLEQRGVKVDGHVVVRELSRAQATRQTTPQKTAHRFVLAEHDSLPLREDIKVTLKVSQNLHAEMLLRTMSRVLNGKGSAEDGLNILNNFAQQVGVNPDEVRFADGSGLSRQTLVTPDALIKLLEFMSREPYFQPFYDALPVAGVDGTLGDRFQCSILKGRIHAKTGSMEYVNALSGYMDLPGGRRLAFVIIGNHQPLHWKEATEVVDRITMEIYRHYARAR